MEKVKTLIIGSGPAGYTAAIYAGRANLQPVLYSGLQPGGQLTTTTIVENFPGFHEGIDANQLMSEMREQAKLYGADLRDGSIVKADLSSRPFHLEDERGNQIEAETVIIATGANWRRLNIGDEAKYIGHGVHFCQHCDGPFYKGKNVAVIGGGNSGLEAAIDLAGICNKVTVFEFGDTLRADTVLQEKAKQIENMSIFTNAQTTNVKGDGTKLTALTVKDRLTEEEKDYEFDGVFVQIGLAANSDAFKEELEQFTGIHQCSIKFLRYLFGAVH